MDGQLKIYLPSEQYGREAGVLSDFMNDLVVNSEVSVRTAYNYYMVTRSLAKFLSKERYHLDAAFEEVELGTVSAEFMLSLTKPEWDRYLTYYLIHKSEKCNSYAFRITVFRRFYSWLAANEKQAPPLFVMETKRPAHATRKPKPVSTMAMREIVRNIKGELQMRDICIVTLAYECGLGLDELTALQIEDLEINRIRVRSDSGRVRYVPLSPAAVKAIDQYLPTRIPPIADGNPLFVSAKRGKLGRTAIYDLLAKAVHRSEKLSRHISFRDLQQTWVVRTSQECEDEMQEHSRINSQWYLGKRITSSKDIILPADRKSTTCRER